MVLRPTTLSESTLDLARLDRHERRAWSRQKPAILAFMNIMLTNGLAAAIIRLAR
jgi:hypothetical protein